MSQQCDFSISVTEVNLLASTEEVQSIASPNYPLNYSNNVKRTFIIHSPVGSHVKLIISDLAIQNNCRNDHLIIYDGKLYYLIFNQ